LTIFQVFNNKEVRIYKGKNHLRENTPAETIKSGNGGINKKGGRVKGEERRRET
jgi:hypothetical protein